MARLRLQLSGAILAPGGVLVVDKVSSSPPAAVLLAAVAAAPGAPCGA